MTIAIHEDAMRFQHVAILAPAFQPTFQTTLHFASLLVEQGVKVTLVSAEHTREAVAAAQCDFHSWDMVHTTWAMTGFPFRKTGDKERQSGFLRATEKGATRTLLFQVDQAQELLLEDFPKTLATLRNLSDDIKPDVWVVDQLCHSLILALHALDLPFHSLCIAHPAAIPTGDLLFGVPSPWPVNVPPHLGRAQLLIEKSKKLEAHLNQKAAHLMAQHAPDRPVPDRLASLCGAEIIFNYPEFSSDHRDRLNKPCHFMGACFAPPDALEEKWQNIFADHKGKRKFLVSMGHILNARNDVLARILLAVRRHFPDAAVYVASGPSERGLTHFRSESVVIEPELPLVQILPHVDLAIFHGGVNTFTEALYFGIPMITMPLSFDQYAIARDAEDAALARAMDPNHFDANEIVDAVHARLIESDCKANLAWSETLKNQSAQQVVKGWLQA